MKAKKIWANFSVKDAMRTNQFYTQLGFTPNNPNNDPKLASFLFGKTDFVIYFFEQGSQIDNYLPSGSKNTSEIIFTLSAETKAEVNEWQDKVKEAMPVLICVMAISFSIYSNVCIEMRSLKVPELG